MCIAIVAPAGKVVRPEHLREAHNSNNDGSGYAYVDKDSNKVVIKKGYFTAEAFTEAYQRTLEEGHGETSPMLLHFRIATMGKVERDNCHPFAIDNGALIHNGILFYGVDRSGKDRSDTRIFAEYVGKSFTYDRVNRNMKFLKNLARSNKIALLFDDRKYAIINEDLGLWDDGIWYSNRSYVPYTRGSTGYYSGRGYSGGYPYGAGYPYKEDWE